MVSKWKLVILLLSMVKAFEVVISVSLFHVVCWTSGWECWCHGQRWLGICITGKNDPWLAGGTILVTPRTRWGRKWHLVYVTVEWFLSSLGQAFCCLGIEIHPAHFKLRVFSSPSESFLQNTAVAAFWPCGSGCKAAAFCPWSGGSFVLPLA